jgi:hypothetical protein
VISSNRTPTRVLAISRVRQWGLTIGSGDPTTLPARISREDVTSTAGGERVRTRTASAVGPGAEAWVKAQKPGWARETELRKIEGDPAYQARWIARDQSPERQNVDVDDILWEIQAEISGGHQAVDAEPVTGGLPPVRFDGPFMPWRCSVTVRARRRGAYDRKKIKLPPILSQPWVLDRQPGASRESDPVRAERGTRPEDDVWAREARLEYIAFSDPSRSPLDEINDRKKDAVVSYYLK